MRCYRGWCRGNAASRAGTGTEVTEQSVECAIWPGSPATKIQVTDGRRIRRLRSERADGAYAITLDAERYLSGIDDRVKARLTTWLVDQRLQGDEEPVVTHDVIDYAIARRPLTVDERAERLLRFLGAQSDALGAHLTVSRTPILAWTESTDVREAFQLEDYLDAHGLIKGRTMSGPEILTASVTIDGHRQIANEAASTDSAQVFVAMWFHENTDSAYSHGIEPAIRDAGYRPLRIDQKEHLNKIEDEIVAEIRRSRFIVADFTQGDGGARGGVYYEAGLAHGLGLPSFLPAARIASTSYTSTPITTTT